MLAQPYGGTDCSASGSQVLSRGLLGQLVNGEELSMGNWFRDGLVPWRPVRAVLFADKKVCFWIKKKLGLTEYQMAALVWVKGVVIGLLLGWWLL